MIKPKYKVFNYTLAAGAEETIHRPANTLICLDADAAFEIAFDDQPLTTFEKGLRYASETDFKKVRIQNPTAGEITVKLGFASGGVGDSRLSILGELPVIVKGGVSLVTDGVTVASGATTKVVDTKNNRTEALITNLGTEMVYLGGSTVAEFEGLPLAGGQTAHLQTTNKLYVNNPTAGAVKIAIMELRS